LFSHYLAGLNTLKDNIFFDLNQGSKNAGSELIDKYIQVSPEFAEFFNIWNRFGKKQASAHLTQYTACANADEDAGFQRESRHDFDRNFFSDNEALSSSRPQ
jgi:hypothetical protein